MKRFYVIEHSGYRMTGSGNYCTEIMVLDRDYNHTVIRSYTITRRVTARYNTATIAAARRATAAAYCAELNAWHEAAMVA